MITPFTVAQNLSRTSSSVRSAYETSDHAFSWLLKTVSSNVPSVKGVRIFEQERPWATQPLNYLNLRIVGSPEEISTAIGSLPFYSNGLMRMGSFESDRLISKEPSCVCSPCDSLRTVITPSVDGYVLNRAKTLVVHGEPERLDRRANCVIRWMEHPERNLNIELDVRDNSYTVQVKAVYYAIISAMFHRASHVFIYSPNDVVVKVGNGVYKAKKEIGMFDAVRRRVSKSGGVGETYVRLCLLNYETLQKVRKQVEGDAVRKDVPVCYTENTFRKRHFNEILRI